MVKGTLWLHFVQCFYLKVPFPPCLGAFFHPLRSIPQQPSVGQGAPIGTMLRPLCFGGTTCLRHLVHTRTLFIASFLTFLLRKTRGSKTMLTQLFQRKDGGLSLFLQPADALRSGFPFEHV